VKAISIGQRVRLDTGSDDIGRPWGRVVQFDDDKVTLILDGGGSIIVQRDLLRGGQR